LGGKGLALPEAPIPIQNRSGLLGKVGITQKDPVLVPPRLDGIGIQNPPHRATTWLVDSFLNEGGLESKS